MINRESQVSNQDHMNNTLNPLLTLNEVVPKAETPQGQKQRLQSLDVYRGLTMLGMVIVDQVGLVGEGYWWWLVHAEWNGLTLAELVFPAFLFIMGVAIPLATNKNRPIRPKNVLRVVLLFLIGLFINLSWDFKFYKLRIMGILQRMSLCYGIVLLIHWWTEYGTHQIKRRVAALVMAGFLILYTALSLSWEDPANGCYRSNNLDPICSIGAYIDRAIFTQPHMYWKFDPQGLFSTLTASFTTFVGYFFGLMLLKLKKNLDLLIKYWILVAFLCLLAIYPSSLMMPINKSLYTITFLFAVLSTSITCLTLLLILIDYIPRKPGAKLPIILRPLTWLGMNPLAIFFIKQMAIHLLTHWIEIGDSNPYQLFYKACFSWMSPGIGTALYAFVYAIFYTLIAGLLYRFKIFIRL